MAMNLGNQNSTVIKKSPVMGIFFVITNSILPDLTFVRAPITVLIHPSLSVVDSETDKELYIYPNPVKN